MNTKNSRGRGKNTLQFEKNSLLKQENFNDPKLAGKSPGQQIIQILTFNPSGIGEGFFPLFRHDTSFYTVTNHNQKNFNFQ